MVSLARVDKAEVVTDRGFGFEKGGKLVGGDEGFGFY